MSEHGAVPEGPDETPGAAPAPGRRRLRLVLLVLLPVAAGLFGLYWYAMSGRYVTTDNAYVKADITAISPQVDGRVATVEVRENQLVERGAVLFRIDPEPFGLALDMAEARILTVRHEVEAARAEFRQVEAEIDEAEERVRFSQQQATRQHELGERGIASRVRLEEADLELSAGRQRVTALREKLRTVLARLGGDPVSAVELHPAYRAAEAERDIAALDLARTTVRAPTSGIVSRMRLEPGEWVEAGEPAFTIVNLASTYVEANLKETQLEHVLAGQRVEIAIDAYPNHRWRGEVASLAAATGAEFAVIPPQNATGNWVKVVQRVPVRIGVDQPDGLPPLRAGMTVSVSIDTEREPRLAQLLNRAVAGVRGAR